MFNDMNIYIMYDYNKDRLVIICNCIISVV